jgi:hypothetical protein
LPTLEPVGVYVCNVHLGLVVEAALGEGQLGTIILVDPATQASNEPLRKDFGLAAATKDKVLDLRATALKGATPSSTARLTVDVYQTVPGNPDVKLDRRSFGDSKRFGAGGVARLMVSVLVL